MDTPFDSIPSSTVTFDGQHLVYFVRRDEFRKDLQHKDDEFCYHVLNSFIKMYQSCEKDLINADPEIVGPLKLRQDDLIICSLGVLAHMNWDIERISRGIHSTKVRALLRQLVIFMFPENTEYQATSDADFFSVLLETNIAEFTPETIFAPWICARWLLYINRFSHFPIVVTKQTVSNPYAIVDHSLIQAEAHGKCVQAAGFFTGSAACFLHKMVIARDLNMRIPTAECFLKYDPMNAENFVFWEAEVKPEFDLSDVIIEYPILRCRTIYDMLVANFSACHIKSSKALCFELLKEKPAFDQLPAHVFPFVKFDMSEIIFYAQALGIEIGQLKSTESTFCSNVRNSPSLSASLFVASRKLVLSEEKKKVTSMLEDKKDKSVTEKMKADSLLMMMNQIELADEPGEPDEPAPSDADFEKYHCSGPIFFSYFAVINFKNLMVVFDNTLDIGTRDAFFPNRLSSPQALAEHAGCSIPKHQQPKAFLIIGKIKQMQNLRQESKCASLAEMLVDLLTRPSDTFSMLCLSEIVRARVLVALMTVSRPIQEVLESHKNFMLNCIQKMGTRPPFYRIVFTEILNAGLVDDVSKFLRTFRNDYLDVFFVLLADHLKTPNPKTKDDFNKQYMVVLSKVLPDGPKNSITLNDFIESVEYIWHPDALKLMLNSTLMFYNYLVKSNEQHYLVSTVLHRVCYTLPDTVFALKEVDRSILRSYSGNMDTILRAILRQANRFLSTDPFVLRATGDFTFVQGLPKLALYYYTNCMLATFNHLSLPLTCYKPGIDDLFWKKYITCLLEFKKPTEAAVTTHLVNQMFEILPAIPRIIEGTRQSIDAVSDCFPFIGDVAVFETMAASYQKIPQYRRLQEKLLTSVLSKTFHTGGSKQQHVHESLRRKLQWLRVLCAQVFELVDA